MWYKCLNKNCGFVFHRVGKCIQCPDCGKENLREATQEEINSVDKNNKLKQQRLTLHQH